MPYTSPRKGDARYPGLQAVIKDKTHFHKNDVPALMTTVPYPRKKEHCKTVRSKYKLFLLLRIGRATDSI